MVDHENKVIFVHVAKTGGSSISQFYSFCAKPESRELQDPGRLEELNEFTFSIYNRPYSTGVHDDINVLARGIEKVHGEKLEDYHKFSIIRNPADYVRSCWTEWHRERFPRFEEFIVQGWFKAVIVPQARGHYMVGDHIVLDRLFIFENLPHVFQHVRDLLKVYDMPDIHVNGRPDQKRLVDPWIADKINEVFWEDYNIYQTLKRNQ